MSQKSWAFDSLFFYRLWDLISSCQVPVAATLSKVRWNLKALTTFFEEFGSSNRCQFYQTQVHGLWYNQNQRVHGTYDTWPLTLPNTNWGHSPVNILELSKSCNPHEPRVIKAARTSVLLFNTVSPDNGFPPFLQESAPVLASVCSVSTGQQWK
jgi:hypothetical protein